MQTTRSNRTEGTKPIRLPPHRTSYRRREGPRIRAIAKEHYCKVADKGPWVRPHKVVIQTLKSELSRLYKITMIRGRTKQCSPIVVT